MTIIIAGAGIAGLTLGLSLRQIGVAAEIYEQVPELKPLGVGINVQPHAVRELFEMGLEADMDATGIRTRELCYFTKKGLPIWSEPRGTEAGYRWPQFSVHRGKLHMMLLQTAIAAGVPVHTGQAVTGVAETADGVDVTLRGADGATRTVSGSLLVAADGIHSAVRAQFHPGEGAPRWSGAVLWRGTTVAKPFLSGASIASAGHEFQKFVTYPIGPADPETGLALINWIAERKFDPAMGWKREDYSRAGADGDFLPWFEPWVFDWLDVPGLIRSAEQCYEYPMVDRDPLERWTFGRVTLMGDAAHPMYPIGSNGASQAILDARVFARAVQDHGVGLDALAAYEAERRPATTRVVLANRGNGPDHVMQIVEERCGGQFGHIDEVLSPAERQAVADGYKKIAGMDVETLNQKPSIVVRSAPGAIAAQ
ncbi:2-polyprenyl-6-methoxyphenol hydroxylase [Devosia enhydra]|uniref:2-polyprenyl-6-methoxyphenol hydroxylase n=1 Tax=Devosia enhydra TaxID=665118 RepID=A0A1K2HT74_9HYPH|nr:flavin-dependent oxidoreductase [Devosia enhydra]SFZ81227.1 2-polyprenyl-6-methoxyphenol hydroxylase [Devosia enhydra]